MMKIKKIESGQNKVCVCFDDLCKNSPWWTKTTRRRPATRSQAVVTTESLHPTDQHDVTWYSSDTPTDSEGVPLPTDSEGIPLPTDSEGAPLPNDSEGVPMIEKGMLTQSMGDHILPHTTDKIQCNGVQTLNDDMFFATSLTLLISIFL